MRGDTITEQENTANTEPKIPVTTEEVIAETAKFYKIRDTFKPETLEILFKMLETNDMTLLDTIEQDTKGDYQDFKYECRFFERMQLDTKYSDIIKAVWYKCYSQFDAINTLFSYLKTEDFSNSKYLDENEKALHLIITKGNSSSIFASDADEMYNIPLKNLEYIYNLEPTLQIKLIVASFMLRDEELTQKYDLITMVERLLCEHIALTDVEKFKKIDNFATTKESYYELPVIIKAHSYKYEAIIFNFLPYYIVGKSEKLSKLTLLFIYTGLITYHMSFRTTTLNLNTEMEQNLIEFIKQNKYNKVPILALLSYKDCTKVTSKFTVTKDEFLEYILRCEWLGQAKDFLLEKSDICNFKMVDTQDTYPNCPKEIEFIECDCDTVNLKRNFQEWYTHMSYFYCKNVCTDENDELAKRLKAGNVALGFNNIEIDFTAIIKDYTLTPTAQFAVFNAIYDDIDSTIQDVAKDNNFDHIYDCTDKKEALDLLLEKYPEFIDFNIKNQKIFDQYQKLFMAVILADFKDKFKDKFTKLTPGTNKTLLPIFIKIYQENPSFQAVLLDDLKDKTLATRKKAFLLLKAIDLVKYKDAISDAISAEQNDKFKEEMQISLVEISDGTTEKIFDEKDITLLLKHEKSINNIPVKSLPAVTNTAGEEVNIDIIKASLIAYAKDKITGISPLCNSIVSDFDPTSHGIFIKQLFNFYIENKANVKDKWILYYCAVYGGTQIINLYLTAINQFVDESRGAMAGETVRALSLNNDQQTLIIIEEMSRKFKHKTVKKSALEALTFAAKELNITVEELADKIVPKFDFDEKMTITYDYGSRKFTAFLTPALELEVTDEKGKVMKNLPKVGAKDDAEIATKSFNDFKEMKKQIKATVKTQTERLELALGYGRTWKYDNFTELFMQNPIMYKFATTLIWGIYVDGKLTETFRYMDDGSFTTSDEDEFILKSDMIIGLIHPIELDDKLILKWSEHLKDYEIKQSILQIDKEIFPPKEDDLEKNEIVFPSTESYSTSSLKTKLSKAGFETGPVEDAGFFYTFTKFIPSNNITITLEFSGMPISYGDFMEDSTIKNLTFHKDGKLLKISEVPAKLISETQYIISTILKREG